MSMVICHRCDNLIDSDDDPDCFIPLGEGRTRVYCEACRDEPEDDEWNV